MAIIIFLLFQQCNDAPDFSKNNTTDSVKNILDTALCQLNEVQSAYSSCLIDLSSSTLDVVTWNLERFPNNGYVTLGLLEDIIPNMNADIIAVQEITSITDFNLLVDNLNGWEGEVTNISGSLDMGYLYKTCEIIVLEPPSIALLDEVEPRPAIQIKIKHKETDLEVTFFNIHLKCCGVAGSIEAKRRESASIALQNNINNNLPDENVIILGDWNDDIHDGPFDNFINDPNFTFTDEEIGDGNSSNWSYPSWPSHLDHILITNELFNRFTEVKTIKLENCINNVEYNISDHRAVLARFQ